MRQLDDAEIRDWLDHDGADGDLLNPDEIVSRALGHSTHLPSPSPSVDVEQRRADARSTFRNTRKD